MLFLSTKLGLHTLRNSALCHDVRAQCRCGAHAHALGSVGVCLHVRGAVRHALLCVATLSRISSSFRCLLAPCSVVYFSRRGHPTGFGDRHPYRSGCSLTLCPVMSIKYVHAKKNSGFEDARQSLGGQVFSEPYLFIRVLQVSIVSWAWMLHTCVAKFSAVAFIWSDPSGVVKVCVSKCKQNWTMYWPTHPKTKHRVKVWLRTVTCVRRGILCCWVYLSPFSSRSYVRSANKERLRSSTFHRSLPVLLHPFAAPRMLWHVPPAPSNGWQWHKTQIDEKDALCWSQEEDDPNPDGRMKRGAYLRTLRRRWTGEAQNQEEGRKNWTMAGLSYAIAIMDRIGGWSNEEVDARLDDDDDDSALLSVCPPASNWITQTRKSQTTILFTNPPMRDRIIEKTFQDEKVGGRNGASTLREDSENGEISLEENGAALPKWGHRLKYLEGHGLGRLKELQHSANSTAPHSHHHPLPPPRHPPTHPHTHPPSFPSPHTHLPRRLCFSAVRAFFGTNSKVIQK